MGRACNCLGRSELGCYEDLGVRKSCAGMPIAIMIDERGEKDGRMNRLAPHTGAHVSFRLAQVICPDVDEVVGRIDQELEITGQIVVLSDGPKGADQYAIIEVRGISQPVIVPMAVLRRKAGAEVDTVIDRRD